LYLLGVISWEEGEREGQGPEMMMNNFFINFNLRDDVQERQEIVSSDGERENHWVKDLGKEGEGGGKGGRASGRTSGNIAMKAKLSEVSPTSSS
jgi:hypothetical protein